MKITTPEQKIQDAIESHLGEDEAIALSTGFEEAFIGIARQFNKPFAVYDRAKCIDILINRDGVTDEDAEEYFQFNVEGAYIGESTPAYVNIV